MRIYSNSSYKGRDSMSIDFTDIGNDIKQLKKIYPSIKICSEFKMD